MEMKGLLKRLIPVNKEVIEFWRNTLELKKLEIYNEYNTVKHEELRFIMDNFTPFPHKELEIFIKNPWELVLRVVRGAILVNSFSYFMKKILPENPLAWYIGLYLVHSAVDNNYLKYDRLLERPDLLKVNIDKDFTPLVPLPSTNIERWLEREKISDINNAKVTIFSIAQELEGKTFSFGYDFVKFFLEGYEKIKDYFNLRDTQNPLEKFVTLRKILYRLNGLNEEDKKIVKKELERWGIIE